MRQIPRIPALVTSGVIVAMLTACGTTTTYPTSNVVNTYPSTAPASMEYGRIVGIEYLPAGTQVRSGGSIIGAVVGGIAGAALGSTIGGGSGRAAATVLGGVAGAAVGNNIARNNAGVTGSPAYRITMESDNGVTRIYEVPATGDLRVGDRVRIDGGVIYRA